KIFDVAGNLLFSKKNGKENNVYQDLIWSCPKISSGVYFAIVTAGSETKKLSIAILK
ncbi:MAG: T9SS type A sorting domain-containing protein, partial [Candidatus Cloacimonetes bacterium]|nr:T9SS type A sorting domain-containing protein [Candidatus Cloacimonadota bacterium]